MPEYKIALDQQLQDRLEQAIQDPAVAPGAVKKSEIMRRAVALYLYLQDKVSDKSKGLRVAIIDGNLKPVEIIDPLP